MFYSKSPEALEILPALFQQMVTIRQTANTTMLSITIKM
jgi:hypothetical protein